MGYFKTNFPKFYYPINGKLLAMVDILRNATFSRQLREDAAIYKNYTWGDGDTVTSVATELYKDPFSFWTIARENDVIDPLTELPLSNAALNRRINSVYRGRAWFVAPTSTVTEGDTSSYKPGINNEGRGLSIRGASIAWGDFTDNAKTTFEFRNGGAQINANTRSIDASGLTYPAFPNGQKVSDGVDWYFGDFLPKVGALIVYRWDDGIVDGAGFDSILASGPFADQAYRVVEVTAVNTKAKTFSVVAADARGTPPTGSRILSAITTGSTPFYCKVLWKANCYNHEVNMGRLLVTTTSGATNAKATVVSTGVLSGIGAFVLGDLSSSSETSVRKFWIYNEVAQAKNALEYFVDTATNSPIGTSATPVLNSGNTSDSISHLARYVTQFYGPTVSARAVSIYENEIALNESNRNIKVLPPQINNLATTLFQQEMTK